jgi:uncharacterized damage-inducible protein DinB
VPTVKSPSAPTRPALLYTGSENDQLAAWLDWYRATLLTKAADLSVEQLKALPVATSELTLLGLVRHMTGCEEWWFQEQLTGVAPNYTYDASEDPDVDFHDLDSHSVVDVWAAFDAAVDVSRRALEAADLDAPAAGTRQDGSAISVRWIANHMIEEYARHVGHADILRELIDGATGY